VSQNRALVLEPDMRLTRATAATPVVLSPYSQSVLGCRLRSAIGGGAGVPQSRRVRPAEMTGREGGAMAERSDRGAPRPVRWAGGTGGKAGGSSQPVRGGRRVIQVDNFKSLLVAWIIGCHALLGYTAIGGWPYDEVNEITMSPRSELLMSILLGPTALFVIGTFFFLAGLFAPAEMARLGPAHFARTRMTRLGLPWLAFALFVWPLFMWLAYRSAGQRLSYWQAFLGRQPFLDSGPLWFAQVLMYLSVGYALWRWRRRGLRFRMGAVHGKAPVFGRRGHCSFLVRRTPAVSGPQPANLGPAPVAMAAVCRNVLPRSSTEQAGLGQEGAAGGRA
jgi:hypothetical protein